MLSLLFPLLLAADPETPPPIAIVALDRKEPVSYEKEVLPILEAKCLACHSGNVRRNRYDMATHEGLLKGGKTGVAIVPGKSAESLFIKMGGRTQKPTMPPKDEEPLTPKELALLKLWIDQGAKGSTVARSPIAVTLRPLPANVQPVRALAISPDKSIVAVGRGNQILLHDAKSGDRLRTLGSPTAHASIVDALAFAPDGHTLASGSFREVKLWDPETGEERQKLTGFADRVVALSYSADGKYLATGGGAPTVDGEVTVFDATNAEPVLKLPSAHSDTVFGVAFSPDSTKLVTGGADKFVKVFEVPSGQLLKTFEGHTHHVLDVGWKADGKLIASAGADDVIKIWDYEKGEQTRTIKGHGKQVTRLAFIGKTAKLLTCSGDATARVWDVDNGRAERTLPGGSEFLHAVAASADGTLLASGGEDGVVRVYDAAGKLLRTLNK
jgi:WD40 repeat protein